MRRTLALAVVLLTVGACGGGAKRAAPTTTSSTITPTTRPATTTTISPLVALDALSDQLQAILTDAKTGHVTESECLDAQDSKTTLEDDIAPALVGIPRDLARTAVASTNAAVGQCGTTVNLLLVAFAKDDVDALRRRLS